MMASTRAEVRARRGADPWAPAWSAVLAAVVLGPLLGALVPGGGYLLVRDAVSTPRSFLTDSALGLGGAAPRAVPQDAAVALASSVVDGGALVVALTFAALVAAGWGAAAMVTRLLPGGAGTGSRIAAATVAIWNPYVAERLLQGHWSLLVGYAMVPWTVVAAVFIRDRTERSRWAPLVLCLGVAGLTPTGVLLCALVATAVLAAPGGKQRALRVVGGVAAAAVASAPWLVATALSAAGTVSDPAGVAAFSARAEPGLGTLGSVAGLGGIWNSAAVPDSRTTLFALVGTVVLLALAAAGAPFLYRRRTPVLTVIVALGAVSVIAVALAATGVGIAAGEWAAEHVPGAGLARDGQKWVALWMPALALGAAAAVRNVTPARTALCVGAVIVVLPDLAWGVRSALTPVVYPAAWAEVSTLVGESDATVAVVPSGTFRVFPFVGDAPVLDPAPRWFDADVLQTGDLPVGGTSVAGEGDDAREVETALLDGADPEELARRGVGWVLVQKTSPGETGMSARTLAGLDAVYDDDDLALYAIPEPAPTDRPDRAPAVAAHATWGLSILSAGAVSIAGFTRRRFRTAASR